MSSSPDDPTNVSTKNRKKGGSKKKVSKVPQRLLLQSDSDERDPNEIWKKASIVVLVLLLIAIIGIVAAYFIGKSHGKIVERKKIEEVKCGINGTNTERHSRKGEDSKKTGGGGAGGGSSDGQTGGGPSSSSSIVLPVAPDRVRVLAFIHCNDTPVTSITVQLWEDRWHGDDLLNSSKSDNEGKIDLFGMKEDTDIDPYLLWCFELNKGSCPKENKRELTKPKDAINGDPQHENIPFCDVRPTTPVPKLVARGKVMCRGNTVHNVLVKLYNGGHLQEPMMPDVRGEVFFYNHDDLKDPKFEICLADKTVKNECKGGYHTVKRELRKQERERKNVLLIYCEDSPPNARKLKVQGRVTCKGKLRPGAKVYLYDQASGGKPTKINETRTNAEGDYVLDLNDQTFNSLEMCAGYCAPEVKKVQLGLPEKMPTGDPQIVNFNNECW